MLIKQYICIEQGKYLHAIPLIYIQHINHIYMNVCNVLLWIKVQIIKLPLSRIFNVLCGSQMLLIIIKKRASCMKYKYQINRECERTTRKTKQLFWCCFDNFNIAPGESCGVSIRSGILYHWTMWRRASFSYWGSFE